EKLAKKKDSYKKGYDLNIQHGHEAKLEGEIGQSNNAFAVPEISYVKSSYLKGSDKDTSDGNIEKTVQIEIRTKGKLIPGVEWFFELQNKKDPEGSKRTLHYNLLHRKVWEEATKEEKLQGWYISEDENKLINEKTKSNSYPTSEFDGKVFVRWLSERVIVLRIAHTEPNTDKKSNVDSTDPDSDRYVKHWQLRVGVEKREDQEEQEVEPKIKWTSLKKQPLSGGAIAVRTTFIMRLSNGTMGQSNKRVQKIHVWTNGTALILASYLETDLIKSFARKAARVTKV
ncbi:MAG: hypothetical protein EZS28_048967, partial [Streblomastix strix]